MRRWGESGIYLGYPKGLRASLQTFSKCDFVCLEYLSICLSQWWLILVLLGVDGTLGDGCEI